jgi:hypothetical protein
MLKLKNKMSEEDIWQESLLDQLRMLKQKMESDIMSNVMLDCLASIVDELCFDLCLHVHQNHKFNLLIPQPSESRAYCIVNVPGYDVHGMIPEKVPKNEFFNCDHCGTKVGAAKYAGK